MLTFLKYIDNFEKEFNHLALQLQVLCQDVASFVALLQVCNS
jgi:hypothetical protein